MTDPLVVVPFIVGVHQVEQFDCGFEPITQWLKDRVHEGDWPDKTTVMVALDGDVVVGFYALLASSIKFKSAPAALTDRQRDRYDLPAFYLKVIAVDHRRQGSGLGSDLLMHALRRADVASRSGINAAAFWLHAANDDVAEWYAKRQFLPLVPNDPRRSMYISMARIRATFEHWGYLADDSH